MTEQEQKAMNKLVDFWNELVKLQPVHVDEFNIYRFHFHGIQAQLIARGYIKDQLESSPQGHLPAPPERTSVISKLINITLP
jgi:hypothetical protein